MTENLESISECVACSGRTKKRSGEELGALLNRLSRIEGQVRGIKSMVEKSAYCVDILIQVSAVTAALNSFNRELLAEHIRTCVTDDIKAERVDAVDELVEVLKRLIK